MTVTTHNRVVIVGGGIAGVATAAALRSGGYAGEVVLVDASDFPYDRPPLSKDYLAGDRDLEQIALQPPQWYADQRIDLFCRMRVGAIVPADAHVEVRLGDGRHLTADHVVLATGGVPALPPIPGLHEGREAGTVHVLRSFEDADRLRRALVPEARLLVVGAGLIGAEAASTARRLGCRVTIIDPLDPPLVAATGPEVAAWLHHQHVEHGIETVTTTLESVQLRPDGLATQLAGEQDFRMFDAVLIGVGIVPDTGLAEAAGLIVDRGVVVDERQVTSHHRVLAVGDVARRDGGRRTEHWEAAQHDGQRAAATILGNPPPASGASWWWSDRHDRHVEGVGEMHHTDGDTSVVRRGEPGVDRFAVFTLRAGRVIGAVAVDDPNATRAARRLIDRAIAVEPEELGDPMTDLRKLLRR